LRSDRGLDHPLGGNAVMQVRGGRAIVDDRVDEGAGAGRAFDIGREECRPLGEIDRKALLVDGLERRLIGAAAPQRPILSGTDPSANRDPRDRLEHVTTIGPDKAYGRR
jgi:hypothetical protein